MTRKQFASFLLLTSAAFPIAASAQTSEAPQAAPEGGEIIVTGTRASGMQAADSAAPIQLLSETALEKVGQPNLNQALTQMVPSFQAQSQGTDMASFALSARLRGLNPNHTLVMVNGKRRHGNSILQVVNSAFGGSAAPSIDLIPPDSVRRIEIFQEGAAAQYGSDAIAGVINIILKSDTSGFTLKGNAGQYYDGEGTTYSASGNFGMPVGDSGFLNFSLFHRRNDWTTVGDGQITVRNLDGSTVQLSGANRRFQPIYNDLNARNGTAAINGGQPKSQLNVAFYNFGYDFGGVEFYSFGNVSYRQGRALQAYRPPNRICVAGTSAVPTDPASCFAPTAADGMVPWIEVKQDEYSLTAGLRGEASGWDWDLSATYGDDMSRVYTTNSAHASFFAATGQTPREFYDGAFQATQFVTTLDLSKDFEIGLEDPLTFAMGGEYRRDTYEIFAGDDLSRYIEGGQSFPGYALSDAALTTRTAKAVYGNIIVHPVTDWSIDLAGRYEDYSDFGDTVIGKITTRYDFTPEFALRATASTGFRAPTLAESGYSATNVAPTSATIQLAPGSSGALAAGFGALKPEKATNISIGTVVRPAPRMVVTLDGYYIKIRDRIVSSGSITGQRSGTPVLTPLINGLTPSALVTSAIIASGKDIDPTVVSTGTLSIQTYTNGIDTETFGAELSVRYPIDLSFGSLDLTLGANYGDTKVIANRLGTLFNAQAEAMIETSAPKFKGVVGALLTSGKFSANARATYYSKSTVLVSPAITVPNAPIAGTNYFPGVVKAATIVDLEVGYDLTEWANLAIGANNLLDKKPEIPGLVRDYVPSVTIAQGTSPYVNGSTTINGPYGHGPYGTNGGYYYARVTLRF
jgi:iron complex outermembrane receptor protein